jgi:hypothetical protein
MTKEPATEPPDLPTEAEFSRLVVQANAGDSGAMAKLRELLDNRPEIWQRVGDLAAHAERLLIDLIAAGNALMAEALRRKLREMRVELLSPTTSLLEKMAVDRVLACWLHVQFVDSIVAKAQGGTITHARYQLQRQTAADRRYTAAVKALAELRRLLPNSIGGTSNKTPAKPLRLFPGETPNDAATA